MRLSARALKMSGISCLTRLLPLICLVLVCFALPQQTAAQATGGNPSSVAVSIADASFGEGDGTVTLTASLSETVGQDTVLRIIYRDDTATVSEDLFGDPPLPKSVTIMMGTLSTDFTIRIRDDGRTESTETFSVFLGASQDDLPPGVTFDFSDSSATITIIDNDEPSSATVSIADANPVEERIGSINFRVSLSIASTSDVVLGVTYGGGTDNPATPTGPQADLGSDRPTTVTIESGNFGATLRVPIADDSTTEGDETFTVSLTLPDSNPINLELSLGKGQATGTIVDDDGTVVSIENATAVENVSGGTLDFTVSLSRAIRSDVMLNVTYAVGVTNPVTLMDPQADLGSDRPTTVMIGRGDLSATLRVPITNDNLVEGNETFTVSIREDNSPEDVITGTGVATGTITDDDEGVVTLSPSPSSSPSEATEGNSFTYTVSLSAPADEAVNLTWTASTESGDNATVADDLQTTTNTVTFAANDSADKTFTIATTQDSEDEPNETFTVTLTPTGTLPDGVEIDTNQGSLVSTIVDDDDDPSSVAVSIADASFNEGDGTVTLTASISSPISPTVFQLTYQDGTATVSEDLSGDPPAARSVTIGGGTLSADFTLRIRDDTRAEPTETFHVSMGISPNNIPPGVNFDFSNHRATITIIDNDPVLDSMVSIVSPNPVVENVGNVNFRVNLTRAVTSDVVLGVTYGGGDDNPATPDDDLGSDRPTTVTIEDGDLGATLTVPITNDNLVEGDETFTVTLAVNTAPAGVTIGTGVAIGTIIDNDESVVSIADATAVAESDTAEFTVSLSQAAATDVVLNVAYGDGTNNPATPADDLGSDRPGTVTISKGETSTTLRVPTANDAIVEDDETFTVTLTVNTAPTGVTVSATEGSATGTITDDDIATVSIAPTSLSVVEGGTFTFRVQMSNPVAGTDVIVRWTARSGGDGAVTPPDMGDGQMTSGIVTFLAGQNADLAFTISTTQDDLVEGDETLTVTLSQDNEGGNSLPPGVEIGSTNKATGTITDNDEAVVNIENASAAENVSGGNISFTVSLSQEAATDVVLDVAYEGGVPNPATPADDLGRDPPATVTINRGETSATLTVPIEDDDIVEGNETFTATLTVNTAPDGVTIGTGVATGTITDDDVALVSIADAAAVAENGTAEFTVSLSQEAATDVVLNVAYEGGTNNPATPAADLVSGRPDTVTIDQGDLSTTLRVPTANDGIVEGDETFTVTLTVGTAPTGVTVSTTEGSATGTITDDDEGVVTLSPSTLRATEGDSFSYTVSLSAPADEAVNLTWTASIEAGDSADLAADLQTTTDTVTFAANDNANKTFTIATTEDTDNEPDKTFTVTLMPTGTLPDGVEIDTDNNSSVATIVDDDDPINATVSIGNASVGEADGNIDFTVSLSTAVTSDVVLDVAYGSGVTNPATPADDLGSDPPATVTIDQGETSATLTVPINNDDIVEGNETFTVTLTVNTAPDGVTIGTGVATGTITDDDVALVSIADAEAVAENGTAEFTVSLSQAAATDIVLDVVYAGGTTNPATPADDLDSGRPDTVTIDQGDLSATLRVPITNDDIVEEDETFTVTLTVGTAPTGVTVSTTEGRATGTITDDDDEAIVVSIGAVSEAENTGDGNLTFPLTLSAAVNTAVTVTYSTADGTATVAGSDYTAAEDSTVIIAAGAQTGEINIAITDDDIVEGNETLTVTLTAVTRADNGTVAIHATEGSATGTITDDDDEAIVVSIGAVSEAENTGDGNLTFPLTLSAAVNTAVTVTYTTADGTATVAGSDYTAVTSGTVEIAANTTETEIDIAINDDEIVEGSETLTVTLTAVTRTDNGTATVSTAAGSATGTITDDDEGVVTLSPDRSQVTEGGSFTYIVSLSAVADEAVNLTWTASAEAGDSATVADDLQQITNTITFAANDNTDQEFTIATTQDSEDEPNETFTVTIEATGTLPDGVEIDTDEDSSVATIVDDDGGPTTPGATVSIGNASVAENVAGGSVDFTVSLSTAVTGDVLLNVVYGGGVTNPATPDDDLGSGRPTTVTITEGETIATLTVPITNDEIVEGNETFTVTLSVNTAPDEVTISTTAGRATGAIIDDDEAEVAITSATSSAAEGATFTFGVTLSEEVDEAVTVRWTATGSGSNAATVSGPGSDLGQNQETTGTVTFLANNTTSQEVTIVTSQDTRIEADETFTVTLSVPGGSSLPNGVMINTNNNSATATIENDDQDPSTSATVSINDATAVAEDGTAIFLVSLSRAVTDNVVLAVTYESDTATIADDLQSNPPATVTITANRTTATLSVPINDDDIVEDNETFTVILGVADGSSLPTGVTISGTRATGTITDNDSSVVSIAPVASPDGQSLVFTVTLSNPVAEDVVLTWMATVDPDDSTSPDLEADTASDLAENGEDSGTVTIMAGSRSARFRVDTTGLSAGQTVTVTLSETGLPDGVTLSQTANRATGTVLVIQESELIEPRRSAALSVLRHHVSRFERMTSSAVHNRLDGSGHGNGFGLSEDLGSGNVVRGTVSDDHLWGAWVNASFAGFDGESTGRQVEVYTGIDYLSDSGKVVIGTLLGVESTRLDVGEGEADYESEFLQFGVYGGVRLAKNLIWDGAFGYGTSRPGIAQDDVFATYDSQRITVRNQLTGSYDLLSSGRLKLSPQLGVLYARERISGFIDSAGGFAAQEVLEIGRISAGPSLTWQPRQGREVEFGIRLHWDVLNSGAGREREVSGSADLGIRFPVTPNMEMGIFLEADGLGITDEFATYGGRIEIRSTY